MCRVEVNLSDSQVRTHLISGVLAMRKRFPGFIQLLQSLGRQRLHPGHALMGIHSFLQQRPQFTGARTDTFS